MEWWNSKVLLRRWKKCDVVQAKKTWWVMEIPPEITVYVDSTNRRIAINTRTLTFVEEHLTHNVFTHLGNKPLDYVAFMSWIGDNVKGHWALRSSDVNMEQFFFEKRNDAILFKLKWGG